MTSSSTHTHTHFIESILTYQIYQAPATDPTIYSSPVCCGIQIEESITLDLNHWRFRQLTLCHTGINTQISPFMNHTKIILMQSWLEDDQSRLSEFEPMHRRELAASQQVKSVYTWASIISWSVMMFTSWNCINLYNVAYCSEQNLKSPPRANSIFWKQNF